MALLKANSPADQLLPSFDPHEWLANFNNLALALDDDVALFEHREGSSYTGHIFFASRGAKAFRRARMMLDFMRDALGATQIHGEAPEWRKDVHRFTEKLGFLAYGTERQDWDGRPVKVILSILAFHNKPAPKAVA